VARRSIDAQRLPGGPFTEEKRKLVVALGTLTGVEVDSALLEYFRDRFPKESTYGRPGLTNLRVSRAAANQLSLNGADRWNAVAGPISEELGRAENEYPDYVPIGALGLLAAAMRTELDSVVGRQEEITQQLERYHKLVEKAPSTSLYLTELEPTLAEGYKLASVTRPDENCDPLVLQLISPFGPRRARFWYSRLRLVQAASIRSLVAPARNSDAISVLESVSQNDPHPFLRHAAALSLRGISSGEDWWRYIWTSEIESIGGPSSALRPEAARLLADVTLLLFLIYGTRYEKDQERLFVRATQRDNLPDCLSAARDRRMMIRRPPPPCCEFGLCSRPPVQRDYTGRGDFVEAFCRRQRLAAGRLERLSWHPNISKRRLAKFWLYLETQSAKGVSLNDLVMISNHD